MFRARRRAAVPATVALTILATLALAPAATATFPGRNGRIAFQAQTDHGVQIFTVRPNGRDLTRITDVEGDACVQLLVYNADNPAERLNVIDTVKVQWQAYLDEGALLLSDDGSFITAQTISVDGGVTFRP